MRWYHYLIFLAIPVLILSVIFYIKITPSNQVSSEEFKKIRIAVCPTYLDRVQHLDKARYQIISTASTAESLALAFAKDADLVIGYLDKGIVITDWENVDYLRAGLIHLLEDNGQRVDLSRQMTIYCPDICGEKAQEIADAIRK